MKIEQVYRVIDPDINWIRERIEDAGTQIGSVHFKKRSNGEIRKMAYRLHVKNPSVAAKPKGMKTAAPAAPAVPAATPATSATSVTAVQSVSTVLVCEKCGRGKGVCTLGPFKLVAPSNFISTDLPTDSPKTQQSFIVKKQIDADNNQVTVLDVNKVVRKGEEIVGRGAWRTVPLENVTRISNRGKIYEITYSK